MSAIKDGGTAFPVAIWSNDQMRYIDSGMTLRDYFAAKAPPCPDDYIATQQGIDRGRNPHNDSYKPRLRSRLEIIADWNYEYSDAMLRAREAK